MPVTPIPLRHAALQHAEELDKLQGFKNSTIRGYLAAYNTLADFLPPTVPWLEPMTTDITPQALKNYFMKQVAVHNQSSYSWRRSRMIKIVKWLMHNGYLPWGPNFAEDIPDRRKPAKSPRDRRLSDEEFLKLLATAKQSHVRDYFLCLFVRFTGRRIGEVLGDYEGGKGLVWGDIRWDEDCIMWDNVKARTYGRKMPLTPRLRAILKAWQETYCAEAGGAQVRSNWYLFPALTASGPIRRGRRRTRRLSPEFRLTNNARVCRDLLKTAGLWETEGDGWHILRKTFANQRKQLASDQGRGDAWDMAKISLDHAKVETTRLYVNLNEDYERYAAWAMESEEMSVEAMAKIPELSALATPPPAAPAPDMTKQPTEASGGDAQRPDPVYTDEPEPDAVVIPFTSRRRLRALG